MTTFDPAWLGNKQLEQWLSTQAEQQVAYHQGEIQKHQAELNNWQSVKDAIAAAHAASVHTALAPAVVPTPVPASTPAPAPATAPTVASTSAPILVQSTSSSSLQTPPARLSIPSAPQHLTSQQVANQEVAVSSTVRSINIHTSAAPAAAPVTTAPVTNNNDSSAPKPNSVMARMAMFEQKSQSNQSVADRAALFNKPATNAPGPRDMSRPPSNFGTYARGPSISRNPAQASTTPTQQSVATGNTPSAMSLAQSFERRSSSSSVLTTSTPVVHTSAPTPAPTPAPTTAPPAPTPASIPTPMPAPAPTTTPVPVLEIQKSTEETHQPAQTPRARINPLAKRMSIISRTSNTAIVKCRALFDYEGNPGQKVFRFKAHDQFIVTQQTGDWWAVKHLDQDGIPTGAEGFVPKNFVEIVPHDYQPPPRQSSTFVPPPRKEEEKKEDSKSVVPPTTPVVTAVAQSSSIANTRSPPPPIPTTVRGPPPPPKPVASGQQQTSRAPPPFPGSATPSPTPSEPEQTQVQTTDSAPVVEAQPQPEPEPEPEPEPQSEPLPQTEEVDDEPISWCVARYDFSQESTEDVIYLNMTKGQRYQIIGSTEEQWWDAVDPSTNERGFVPSNYCLLE